GALQLTAQQQPLAVTAQLGLQADGQQLQGHLQLREDAGRYLLQAELDVPQPLPLAGLGQLSGNLRLGLENRGEQWLLHDGQLAARLAQPQLAALAALPPGLRPAAIAMQINPEPGSLATWRESMPLAVQVVMEGEVSGRLDTLLELASQPQWQGQLRDGHLHLNAPRSEEHTSELQSRENLVCRLL